MPTPFTEKIFLSSFNYFDTFDKYQLIFMWYFRILYCSIILHTYTYADITQIFFPDLNFLLFIWDSDHMSVIFVIFPQIPVVSGSIQFFSVYFLFSDSTVHMDRSSRSLIFSPVIFILLLSPSSDVFCGGCCYCIFQFKTFIWFYIISVSLPRISIFFICFQEDLQLLAGVLLWKLFFLVCKGFHKIIPRTE